MNLRWYEGILYGLFSGLTEVLPVSSQAHRFLFQKIMGVGTEPDLLRFFIDLGVLAAIYYSCQNHIIRIIRARRLARVPKSRRKRPLDTRSLMDFSMVRTMMIPVILSFFFYGKIRGIKLNIVWIAIALMVNAVILFAPQYFRGGNRDSRNSSRIHSLLIGLGGATSIIPGISGIGAATSVASLCGVDRTYGFNMILLMNIGVCAGMAVYDVLGIISNGIGSFSIGVLITYLLAAAAAFGGASAAIKIMRYLAAEIGYAFLAFYCSGVALFAFIMNLLV